MGVEELISGNLRISFTDLALMVIMDERGIHHLGVWKLVKSRSVIPLASRGFLHFVRGQDFVNRW